MVQLVSHYIKGIRRINDDKNRFTGQRGGKMEKLVNFDGYIKILNEELILALGCTEPIALAYAAAYAVKVLGARPTKLLARVSGNMFKNVRSVIVPNSGGLTGVKASAILGALGGDSELKLQVLSNLSQDDISLTAKLAGTDFCSIQLLDTPFSLHLEITAFFGNEQASVEIKHLHTNIVKVTRNGETVLKAEDADTTKNVITDRTQLNFDDIYTFASTVKICDIKEMMDKVIFNNMAIAEEGMKGKYGVNIGNSILGSLGNNVFAKMRAYAAAASEARMSGCVLPVVTNSGSGNQGIATSVPLIVYAREKNLQTENLYRALVFASLITILQKTPIGRLSAFCGAVSASCSALAGVAFIEGLSKEVIGNTILNTLANNIGIICDGAKPSCGAKIACSLDSAINGYLLAKAGKVYCGGMVKPTVDETIAAVGRMASKGMLNTDKEILHIMLGD